MTSLLDLPDELLEELFTHMPPDSAVSLGLVTKRLNRISDAPLLWRTYALDTWKFWDDESTHQERVPENPADHPWRPIYGERRRKDQKALHIFNEMLDTQQSRIERMERLVSTFGHDVKDLLLRLAGTPDEADDVLARRYYSEALLGLIHRQEALQIWNDMEYQTYARLETCLGAFDTFVQGRRQCNERQLDIELDRIAQDIRNNIPDVDSQVYTNRATTIASQLRSMGLLGSTEEEYHYLKNNFICHVLQSDHTISLPLVSTVIFCCVAQRFGLRAWPCNFPFHIHAVVESPDFPPLYETRSTQTLNSGVVWMDPWRHDNTIDQSAMTDRLRQYGLIPNETVYSYLSPAFTQDMVIRNGRNIMNSVNEARDNRDVLDETEIDSDAAFYSSLWSVFLAGPNEWPETQIQRRNYIPLLLDAFKQNYPEDVGLVERFLLPAFNGHPAMGQLTDLIEEHRFSDRLAKPVNRRDEGTGGVKFKVGQPFRHIRFGYVGIIIGWDPHCQAGEPWIEQMRVDALPRGRTQSFYYIL